MSKNKSSKNAALDKNNEINYRNIKGKNVKFLYSLGKAYWYEPFKKFWNKLVSVKAEKEFERFLIENLSKDKKILELGCGTALNLEKINRLKLPFKKYLGIDFSDDMLNFARQKFSDIDNIEFLNKDITDLSDITDRFDIIICTWVLSHLDNPSSFVNKSQQLLSDKGKFFLIFYSEPKWYINFWLSFLGKYFFACKGVSENETGLFKNIFLKAKYSADITSVIEIGRR